MNLSLHLPQPGLNGQGEGSEPSVGEALSAAGPESPSTRPCPR